MPRPFLIGLGSMPFSPSLQLSGFHMLSHTILLKSCELYIIIINLQIKIEVQHKKRTCPWLSSQKTTELGPKCKSPASDLRAISIVSPAPECFLLQVKFLSHSQSCNKELHTFIFNCHLIHLPQLAQAHKKMFIDFSQY